MSKTNAKKEFVEHVQSWGSEVKCAIIWVEDEWTEDIDNETILRDGHTKEELSRFIESLNFDYDSGYGRQELFGTIWYKDGAWSEREEYDGSEWWAVRAKPQLPLKLCALKTNTTAKR